MPRIAGCNFLLLSDSNGVVTCLHTPVVLIDEPGVGSRISSLVAFHGLTSSP